MTSTGFDFPDLLPPGTVYTDSAYYITQAGAGPGLASLFGYVQESAESNGTMINKAILVGRLGADPEVRYTPDGTMVTNFRIATDEQWKDKSGEKVQKTEWHRIVTFGKLAEIAGEYLSKGSKVYVEGSL